MMNGPGSGPYSATPAGSRWHGGTITVVCEPSLRPAAAAAGAGAGAGAGAAGQVQEPPRLGFGNPESLQGRMAGERKLAAIQLCGVSAYKVRQALSMYAAESTIASDDRNFGNVTVTKKMPENCTEIV